MDSIAEAIIYAQMRLELTLSSQIPGSSRTCTGQKTNTYRHRFMSGKLDTERRKRLALCGHQDNSWLYQYLFPCSFMFPTIQLTH